MLGTENLCESQAVVSAMRAEAALSSQGERTGIEEDAMGVPRLCQALRGRE